MTTIHRNLGSIRKGGDPAAPAPTAAPASAPATDQAAAEATDRPDRPDRADDRAGSQPTLAVRTVAGLTRIALGWVFLWAFLDKAFGLGHATASKDAWIDGGSPTFGFLSFAAVGPFKGLYNDIAGAAWADWLFMLGLLGIGVALILGVFVNLAAASGAVMLVMMWTVVLPPENNPFMDDHLIYAAVLVLLALMGAGRWLGLGSWWEREGLGARSAVLR